MTYPDDSAPGTAPRPDYDAVLAAMQDQVDDLIAAMSAQQTAIDSLVSRVSELERRDGPPPAT